MDTCELSGKCFPTHSFDFLFSVIKSILYFTSNQKRCVTEMVQQVKVSVTKPEDLNPIPLTYSRRGLLTTSNCRDFSMFFPTEKLNKWEICLKKCWEGCSSPAIWHCSSIRLHLVWFICRAQYMSSLSQLRITLLSLRKIQRPTESKIDP